jgi:hypothetical protein
MPWTFYHYVAANTSGRDVIVDWIAKQPQGTRARLRAQLNARINELRLVERLDRSVGVGQLHEECSGLYELILKVDKIQYRPIGCYGPAKQGEFTLLTGAIEQGDKFTEPDVCRRAHERASRISDPRYVCLHRFDL